MERAFGLRPFAERSDVPAWARDLVAGRRAARHALEGRVFLDYAAMLEVLRFVAARIEPRRVLAYLPGWEGRYYWQYGDYRPEPRLGGEAGFAALCEGARALGIHLMPMFGGNCVNAWLPRFRDLDPSAYMKSATGNRFHGNHRTGTSRARTTPGWQAWLNPGHPGWRDDLAGQIESLAERFGFDAVFLDTIDIWVNDPDHAVSTAIAPSASACTRRSRTCCSPASTTTTRCSAASRSSSAPGGRKLPPGRSATCAASRTCARANPRAARACTSSACGNPGAIAAAPGLLATIAFQDDTLARSRAEIEAAIAQAARRFE